MEHMIAAQEVAGRQVHEEQRGRRFQAGMAAMLGGVAIIAGGCSPDADPYLQCSRLMVVPSDAPNYELNPVFTSQGVKDIRVEYDFGDGETEVKTHSPYRTFHLYSRNPKHAVGAKVVAKKKQSGATVFSRCPPVNLRIGP